MADRRGCGAVGGDGGAFPRIPASAARASVRVPVQGRLRHWSRSFTASLVDTVAARPRGGLLSPATVLVALCAITMFVLGGQVEAATQGLSSHRVRVRLPEGDAAGLESLAVACGEVVARMAPLDPQDRRWITLRITTGDVPPQRDPLNLFFSAFSGIPDIAHGLCRALLIRACGKAGEQTVQPEALDWLAAAVSGRVLHARWEVLGQPMPDYQPLRHMFSRGAFPRVADLLMLPVPSSRGGLYHLYSLHCDVLLEAILVEGDAPRDPLKRILGMVAAGRTALAATEFVLHDHFAPGESFQTWYERRAALVSRRGRRVAPPSDIRDRLLELETVPIVMPNRGDFGCVRVPIDEVPETLKNYAGNSDLMEGLLKDCFELSKDAPEWLRAPVLQYFRAFELLKKGKMFSFKRKLRQARQAFRLALERQERLITYIDSQELRYTGVDKALAPYVSVIRQSRERRRRLDWRLSDYLDGLDR
ncbi:MAG: hypothetical protein HN742_08410 [Lentisphaerae bacterium]|nr:hypothetical protein [Lentisphaerota bacterium]MBT4818179.1 hypothetical protein [Lentisphaerota bacterium]MBT5610370.1 hypothetical protein [Lentisphaerota bacterium]MBT7056198.1 hypothetical protein [Lentisphaerota bacterium]MBT7841880.1 hypothetical protein [Lentisphaerota bacterium]